MTERITSFKGEYFFLSNFFPVTILFEGILYPSSEHAYVAAKTLDQDLRQSISKVPTAGKVKAFGRTFKLREDWDTVKLKVMQEILENKFSIERKDLPLWLDNTRPKELIEGNTWGDTFWGQCPIGVGQNHLGKILMSIRDDITRRF